MRSAIVIFMLGLSTAGCTGSGPVPSPDPAFIVQNTIALGRQVHAEAIFVAGETFYLAEGRPEKTVSRWSFDGAELPRPLPPGPAPGQLLQASDSFLAMPPPHLGILDYRSYRVNVIDARTARFQRSFVVSPYEVMALNGVGDPRRERLYLFAAVRNPEVRVLDLQGRETLPGLDFFEESYTFPYAWFRGTVDSDGNLYYCPRSSYTVVRVTPDGDASLFTHREGGRYVSPVPIPQEIVEAEGPGERTAWEETRSWVRQLAWSESRLIVSYTVPPGFDRQLLDVYGEDGELIRAEISAPGFLLGSDESGSLWFLANDRRSVSKVRLS